MLSVERSGQSVETVRACERALPRCVSLCDPECVGGTGSVGLCHPKASNVFVWSGGRISGRQYGPVIPFFFLFLF